MTFCVSKLLRSRFTSLLQRENMPFISVTSLVLRYLSMSVISVRFIIPENQPTVEVGRISLNDESNTTWVIRCATVVC